MEQTHTSFCPACKSESTQDHLSVIDHFLTKETFRLLHCNECTLVFTSPRPLESKLSDYYKSENYVSHSSTKKGLVNRLYALIRNYTLYKKVRLIESLVSGRKLLDIGAGTGHFLAKAQKSGFDVLGLEPDADARKVALTENSLTLKDTALLPELNPEDFDVITMWHVLEHVVHLENDVEKIVSLLKKNGVYVVAVPNYTSFDAKYYQSFWAAYDVPRHLYHFSPKSIIKLVEIKGLVFEKILPMKFDSYYVSMLSEKYQGGNLFNAVRIGWLSNFRSKKDKCSSQIYVFRKK